MDAIHDLIVIMITILMMIIIRKFYHIFHETTKIKSKNNNRVSNEINKNFDIEKNKENIENNYNYENITTDKIANENIINNSSLIFNNSKIKTQDDQFIYKSYDDKTVYSYLYELPPIKDRLIIIDTEVSGISSLDHIIELCALEMINGKLTTKYFHSFFNPKKRLNHYMMKRHRLPKEVYKMTYEQEKEVFKSFLKFVSNSKIITHNAVFDMEKINYELNFYDLPIIDKYQFRCSMRIFLDKYSHLSNKFSKLKESCNFLGIKYFEEKLHLAYYDAFLVGKMLEKIYDDENENKNVINNKNNKNNLLNNNYYTRVKDESMNNKEEKKSADNELKNNNIIYSISKEEKEKESFEKLVNDNIEDIYKDLEEQETDKIIENILEEKEKNNTFDNLVNENIEDIFNDLKREEKKVEGIKK